jgi:menaquinone-9 beta-reductase
LEYDLAIVGGGLAGSSLAMGMARRGARVLIVEHQPKFRDRVRGEVMHSWGGAEAEALGIRQPLLDTCGNETRYWASDANPRDLIATTPPGFGCLNFSHPEMQQTLLDLAVEAGAELRRPADVIGVVTGPRPEITIRAKGTEETIHARLVIAADGRDSRVRGWAGFSVRQDPDRRLMAGALHHGLALPEDTVQEMNNLVIKQGFVIVPIGGQRFRSYLYFAHDARPPLSGQNDEAAMFAGCVDVGAPTEWFRHAESIGPLATFNCAARWVDHPHRDGIVLVGDAAASTDPTHGAGLSLTLRDIRVLQELLLTSANWAAAALAYAEAHDRDFASLHRMHGWFKDFFHAAGPEADAMRAKAIAKHAEEPSRQPDIIGLGPDVPSDETARRRFFALD